MIAERINEYVKNVFQLFWHEGVTETMDMLLVTMDILYLRRKNDCDVFDFKDDDDYTWSDLKRMDKSLFSDVYRYHIVPFLMRCKKTDLSFVSVPQIVNYNKEFSSYFEVFHLTDDLFDSLCVGLDKNIIFQLHGCVLDGLLEGLGILKNQKSTIIPHIAKLMCCLLDINIEDKIFVPNCGMGELLILSAKQALISKIPIEKREKDTDGLDTPMNIDDTFLKVNYHLIQQYATESNGVLSYLCAMNLFLHGLEMKHYIDGQNFWTEKFSNLYKGKFTKILAQIIDRQSNLRDLGFNAIIKMLNSKGKAAILVSEAVLFASDSKSVGVRRKMLEENCLEAVISLPKGGLVSSKIKTSILILSKQKKDDFVWFCELVNDGYSKNGKWQRNGAMPLPQLVDNFHDFAVVDNELMYSMRLSTKVLLAHKAMLVMNYYRPIESKHVEKDPMVVFKELQILEDKIREGLADLSKLL